MIDDIRRMSLRQLEAHVEENPDDDLAWELIQDYRSEAQYEHETFGYDDAPSLAHCDDYGTGEGRYHGRM